MLYRFLLHFTLDLTWQIIQRHTVIRNWTPAVHHLPANKAARMVRHGMWGVILMVLLPQIITNIYV